MGCEKEILKRKRKMRERKMNCKGYLEGKRREENGKEQRTEILRKRGNGHE